MELRKSLQRLAVRLANDNEDLRHTVLDISDELLHAFADEGLFPERLRAEVRELRRRIEHTQKPADKKVLNKQIGELRDEIQFLRNRVDRVGR